MNPTDTPPAHPEAALYAHYTADLLEAANDNEPVEEIEMRRAA